MSETRERYEATNAYDPGGRRIITTPPRGITSLSKNPGFSKDSREGLLKSSKNLGFLLSYAIPLVFSRDFFKGGGAGGGAAACARGWRADSSRNCVTYQKP